MQRGLPGGARSFTLVIDRKNATKLLGVVAAAALPEFISLQVLSPAAAAPALVTLSSLHQFPRSKLSGSALGCPIGAG